MSAALGYDTWSGVVLAHIVMIAPFAVILMMVALSQVDRRIDMAARGMGASLWQRISLIIVPNVRFGIISALFLCFVLSWEEIGVTLFITSVNAITLPRLVWMGLRDNVDPAVAAVSVLLITATIVVLAAVLWGREQQCPDQSLSPQRMREGQKSEHLDRRFYSAPFRYEKSDHFGRALKRREIHSLVNPVIVFCETSITEGGDAVVQ